MPRAKASRRDKVAGFIVFLVTLAACLLFGTRPILVLERNAAGRVPATNARRLHGTVPLISRSVTHLQAVRMAAKSLTVSERRFSVYRDAAGMFTNPEELLLVGDACLAFPYQEDQSLIQAFLHNKSGVPAASSSTRWTYGARWLPGQLSCSRATSKEL